MSKFNVGDRCEVIHNALAPECIGHTVTITGIISEKVYSIEIEDVDPLDGEKYKLSGFAAEGCLKKI